MAGVQAAAAAPGARHHHRRDHDARPPANPESGRGRTPDRAERARYLVYKRLLKLRNEFKRLHGSLDMFDVPFHSNVTGAMGARLTNGLDEPSPAPRSLATKERPPRRNDRQTSKDSCKPGQKTSAPQVSELSLTPHQLTAAL